MDSNNITDKQISQALTIISATAKRYRDNKKDRDEIFKEVGMTKEQLYALKKVVMEKLISERKMKFVEVQKQIIKKQLASVDLYDALGFSGELPEDIREITYLACYSYQGNQYHMILNKRELNANKREWIRNGKRGQFYGKTLTETVNNYTDNISMNCKEAIDILNTYLERNEKN